jgi:hypothetical protein
VESDPLRSRSEYCRALVALTSSLSTADQEVRTRTMRFHFLLISFLFMLIVWSGCRDSGSAPAEETGIVGQVYSIGTPGPVPIGWTPPPLERVSTIVVSNSGQLTVKEFPTDEKGRFKTELAPGTYFLRVKESFVPAETGPYTVTPGQFLTVEAHFDNGMR